MNIEVGSYEAKTKLPELLRGIQAGNRDTFRREEHSLEGHLECGLLTCCYPFGLSAQVVKIADKCSLP